MFLSAASSWGARHKVLLKRPMHVFEVPGKLAKSVGGAAQHGRRFRQMHDKTVVPRAHISQLPLDPPIGLIHPSAHISQLPLVPPIGLIHLSAHLSQLPQVPPFGLIIPAPDLDPQERDRLGVERVLGIDDGGDDILVGEGRRAVAMFRHRGAEGPGHSHRGDNA